MKKDRASYTHTVSSVAPGSIASSLGIEPGDVLLSVNGQQVEDIFDYQYLLDNKRVTLKMLPKGGTRPCKLKIDKDTEEELGIEYADGLLQYRGCVNRCIFCFVDQLPKGLRKSLYFKDDDTRLSFLAGNYVTLTNMSDADIERLIRYHLSPVNVSVHTTDSALRCQMLGNDKAGDILAVIRRLVKAGIELNGQIVLCKGYNDGERLLRTVEDLAAFAPQMKSVCVVPVGLTRYREGLTPLIPFTAQDAVTLLEMIKQLQERFLRDLGTRLVYAADEWYLLAKRDVPEAEAYEGYPQLGNGVGMLRDTVERVRSALGELSDVSCGACTVSIATGTAAGAYMRTLCDDIERRIPGVTINVYEIINHFFGESVTVAGLLTGTDLEEQLKGRELGSGLILVSDMVKSEDEPVFLDDISVEQLSRSLQTPIFMVQSNGDDLVATICDIAAGIRRISYG